jgi:hypothetical protein
MERGEGKDVVLLVSTYTYLLGADHGWRPMWYMNVRFTSRFVSGEPRCNVDTRQMQWLCGSCHPATCIACVSCALEWIACFQGLADDCVYVMLASKRVKWELEDFDGVHSCRDSCSASILIHCRVIAAADCTPLGFQAV